MDNIDLLSVADFCMATGISRSTWHKLAKAGQTPSTIRIGGSIRMRREAVEDWLIENYPDMHDNKSTEHAKGQIHY